MKVLFHIEPMLFHGRPFHYAALYDFFIMLAESLRAGGVVDSRFLSNPALAQRARTQHGLTADTAYSVSESSLRDVTGTSSMGTLRILHKNPSSPLNADLAKLYREALGDFEPDVVITISPSPYWKAAFPSAVVLHVDGGLFSRDPLPHVFFLDSDGMFGNSTAALHGDALKSLPLFPEDKVFLDLLRAQFRQRILVDSPFHGLERDLRSRFQRLLLLPLQFAGEFGFDLNCEYDRQGSYLLDVVQRVSPETAVIVTEHPTAIWLGDVIDAETREYVAREHPNVFFAPGAGEGIRHAGQTLLQHADAVVSVSSSLGMQAVFFAKPLLALGTSHLAEYATWWTVEDFNRHAASGDHYVAAIAWMMRHYYMSSQLCREGNGFAVRLGRMVAAATQAGLDRYPLIGGDEKLVASLLTGSPI